MAQFTLYQSTDIGAPQLTGTTGSLISMLDGVLVNGYGTGANFKSSSGWTKPFPNSSSAGVPQVGCWCQPSGTMATLVVNDAAIQAIAAGGGGADGGGPREAFATGWINLISLTGSNLLQSPFGIGMGQFPLLGTTRTVGSLGSPSGSLVWRKSTSNDLDQLTGSRYWQMYADAYTFHLFVATGDTAGQYDLYSFGDIFSYCSPDLSKCMIQGRMALQGTSPQRRQCSDVISTAAVNNDLMWGLYISGTPSGHHYGYPLNKCGAMEKTNILGVYNPEGGAINAGFAPMVGALPGISAYDGTTYISSITLADPGIGSFRGRIRGLCFPCSIPANYIDGQVISGYNEHSGKSFRVVKFSPNNGVWLVEISDTLDTNES